MRYFVDDFGGVHNKGWPFGKFPAWNYYKSTGTHIGTDFIVPVGTPIYAPVDGEVLKVFPNQYKGNVALFVFKFEGVEWGLELCHLRELPPTGMFKEGAVIAISGKTGKSLDGAHLHAVLHRDAMVTKHYQLLTSREAFLDLEKQGAIVDCFPWFLDAVGKNAKAIIEETPPVPEVLPSPPPVLPTPSEPASPPVNAPAPPLTWLVDLIIKVLRTLIHR